MQADRITRYRQRLVELRSRLLTAVEQGAAAVAEDSNVTGERVNPLADPVEVDAAVERSEARLLRMVNAALDRIELGTFGQCSECGGRIGSGRLAALPYAELCVSCERDRESALQNGAFSLTYTDR